MAEDFNTEDAQKLLHNKFIIIIGDSVMRGAYKDLVHFIQQDSFISHKDLREKGELKCCGDELVEGGRIGHHKPSNQTHYREIRQYKTDTVLIRFYFITQVYNKYFETIVEDLLHESSPQPDVIMMNSCLWDMSRYGPRWLLLYRENLDKMMNSVKIVAKNTLFLWLTCMPVGKRARGGFMPRGVEWKKSTLRLDVLEANFFARQAANHHGFDVLDLNYSFRELTHLRTDDDIHWIPVAHRRITCMILNHICTAWDFPRPRRMKPLPLMDFRDVRPPRHHRRHVTQPAIIYSVPTHYARKQTQYAQNAFVDQNNNNQFDPNNNNQFDPNNNNQFHQNNNNHCSGDASYFKFERSIPQSASMSSFNAIQNQNGMPNNWGGNYGQVTRGHFGGGASDWQGHVGRNPHVMRGRARYHNGPY